ncbi:uncharacterized protein K452DRAFT_305824 [Aplosporella prunicola CBS 121167]|uniref:Histone transcription regulator 3 homolog n=1 Tax=Aplosporella prunicola CBS 121167 TaxID=1176127 RepID=A0A6A6BMH5_9PEZI|nr:uncharacterized protein K452DRAFT_305824 [Aplosporella prunicola CBS 121167]KAF2144858.1 hypothetical protein K452DRAFT_305824 [Aplosporella prunicola CBS 121167]
MSQFKALNIESDVESDEEIDDTKEIQIEEALKLYQTALKLHSEGPSSFDAAAHAYKALFESDIFKYPESLSEYRRIEVHGEIDYDALLYQEDYDAGPVQLVGATDSAPNTLPQILHLSYKNHGQFILELLKHRLEEHHTRAENTFSSLGPAEAAAIAEGPLSYFAEALDKDDTDLDLWSRSSSVAALAGSDRIARFCLEAVLEGDDEGLGSILRIPGLEEGFAGVQLRELVQTLQDDLSLSQAPLSSLGRKRLSAALRKRLAPYSFAPLPAEVNRRQNLQSTLNRPPVLLSLTPGKFDWAHVGDSILNEYLQGPQRLVGPAAGLSVLLNLPHFPAAEETLSSGNEIVPSESQPVSQPDDAQVDGQPTAATTEVAGDTEMKDGAEQEGAADGETNTPDQPDQPAMTRKRSTESAGLPEAAEGGRGRSKRIRARESIGEGALGVNGTSADTSKQQGDSESNQFEQADDWLYEIVGDMLAKLGVSGLGSPKTLRSILKDSRTSVNQPSLDLASKDLFAFLQTCSPQAVAILLTGDSIDSLGGSTREAGLAAFLGYAKSSGSQGSNKPILDDEGLLDWSQEHKGKSLSSKEFLWLWLERMLRPCASSTNAMQQSGYMRHQWSDGLKRTVVQTIVNADDFIFERLLQEASDLDARILQSEVSGKLPELSDEDLSLVEMIQTIFELHLDVYSLIKHPGSSVDEATQILQNERLERWAGLTRDVISYRVRRKQKKTLEELEFRYLWATTFHLTVSDGVEQDYVVLCLEELKALAGLMPGPTINIQNNAVMSELSVAAAERELMKINMKDCFMKVFQHDEKDPVAVIENLEPILESSNVAPPETQAEPRTEIADSQEIAGSDTDMDEATLLDARPSPLKAMTQFISTANVTLRLSLWQRLRQAYEVIDYTPKVVSCYLRSIEILVEDMKSAAYAEMPVDQRILEIVKWLRIIDEILVSIIKLFGSENVLECIDEPHMRSSLAAVGELLWMLNTLNVYEDAIRAGKLSPPTHDGRPNNVFPTVTGRLHDTQLRGWILQMLLFTDAMSQNEELFPTPIEEKFEYLRHMHYAFGIRGTCSASNKILLRVMKDELLKMFKAGEVADTETRDTVLCQVLHDLYGLFCFTNPSDKAEYASEKDILDQKTALRLLDFLMYQTRKVNIKDLHKTQLGSTIDIVHGHLARFKPAGTEDLAANRMKYLAFIKSPLNPLDLYRCINGIGGLSTKPIAAKHARIAAKGWHFLMGSIALNRFKSQIQKRQAPIPTEDINIASAFFVQDLEYDSERWETWYSQAQAFDYQIDELVAWSAEKVNKGDPELIQYQRSAIHCYTMAVATAIRNADASQETAKKLAQLYADFGMRIYASSREPLSMNAFSLKDTEERFYSTAQVMKSVPFIPLTHFAAWKFSTGLFKRAIAGNPNNWMNHFVLGKCLWKMHCAEESQTRFQPRPGVQEVVAAFVHSIEELPEKRERREPILEPHYKLLSAVHKLVQRNELLPKVASETLQASHYARQLPVFAPEEDPDDHDDWDDYVLKVLKVIRTADKSNWHHRMTARAARIHFGDPSPEDVYMAALTAKNEFSQSVFTKTMQLQVWKPEFERLGRHFVYTTRYTQFFILLLDRTNDRAGMEALARRVRRRNHEFFEHSKLWHTLCLTYLKMLRRAAQVPEGHEDSIFKSINHDEFTTIAGRLEEWCQSSESQGATYEVLRETLELRRLNNGLMKATLVDDLICDTYAQLYAQVGPTLAPTATEAAAAAALAQQQPPTAPTAPTPVETNPVRTNMMSMQNIMNLEGSSEQTQPQPPTQPAFHVMSMAPQQSEPAPKPRAKGVGRRELMRRADAATTRVVLPSTLPVRGSVAPTSEPQVRVTASSKDAEGQEDASGAAGTGSVEQSAPGSVHDSADDESELSEVDEELVENGAKELGPGFPGIPGADKGVEVEADTDAEDKVGEGERGDEDTRMED